MAIVSKQSVSEASSAKQLPPSVPLNKDRYSLRIKKAAFGDSKSSGKPMITLDIELYHPPTMISKVNGQTYEIGGLEAKMYRSMSPEAIGMLVGDAQSKGFMEQLGLTPEIDTENPNVEQFVGKCFSAICGPEKREQRYELTAAEITEGKKVGDLILGEDGQPSVSYSWKIIGDITPTKHAAPSSSY